MCCIFCVSFRGAAYFGTTAQILLGLSIVVKYSTSLPDVKLSDFQEVSSGPVAILFLYGLLIFAFGCCIFRGIECESLRTLKVSVGGLTLLQSLVLVTHLVLISMTFDHLKEAERMSQVSVLALNLVLTFVQLTTLFLYMIRLAKRDLALLSTRCRNSNSTNSNCSESSLPLSGTSSGLIRKCGGKGVTSNSSSNGKFTTLREDNGRYSVGSSTMTTSSLGFGQRYIDGQWENLHV